MASSKIFYSCPSLPNLTVTSSAYNAIWLAAQNAMYTLNDNRRKSWTAIEDLTECTKNSHKSVSLTSLDSEEQESLRANERIHNRTNRNSTGGISTHSLNEAELAVCTLPELFFEIFNSLFNASSSSSSSSSS